MIQSWPCMKQWGRIPDIVCGCLLKTFVYSQYNSPQCCFQPHLVSKPLNDAMLPTRALQATHRRSVWLQWSRICKLERIEEHVKPAVWSIERGAWMLVNCIRGLIWITVRNEGIQFTEADWAPGTRAFASWGLDIFHVDRKVHYQKSLVVSIFWCFSTECAVFKSITITGIFTL